MKDELGRVCVTRPSDTIKLNDLNRKNQSLSGKGPTWSLFKDQIDNFKKKITSSQLSQLESLLKPDEYLLLCSYPGKIGNLCYDAGQGKNYGSTIVSSNFGRLFHFVLNGEINENWYVSLLVNPYIDDALLIYPISQEYISLLSLLIFRYEINNHGGYDHDLYHKFINEYYHQSKPSLEDSFIMVQDLQ